MLPLRGNLPKKKTHQQEKNMYYRVPKPWDQSKSTAHPTASEKEWLSPPTILERRAPPLPPAASPWSADPPPWWARIARGHAPTGWPLRRLLPLCWEPNSNIRLRKNVQRPIGSTLHCGEKKLARRSSAAALYFLIFSLEVDPEFFFAWDDAIVVWGALHFENSQCMNINGYRTNVAGGKCSFYLTTPSFPLHFPVWKQQ